MQRLVSPTEHAWGGLAPAQWGGREPPRFLPELLGGKRTLGGVRVARISVLTPPLSGEVLLPTLRKVLHLFDADSDSSV